LKNEKLMKKIALRFSTTIIHHSLLIIHLFVVSGTLTTAYSVYIAIEIFGFTWYNDFIEDEIVDMNSYEFSICHK